MKEIISGITVSTIAALFMSGADSKVTEEYKIPPPIKTTQELMQETEFQKEVDGLKTDIDSFHVMVEQLKNEEISK